MFFFGRAFLVALLALVASAAIVVAFATGDTANLVASDEIIRETMRTSDVVVMFCSATCPHCRKLLPDFETTKTKLESKTLRFFLYDIDIGSRAIARFVNASDTPRVFFIPKQEVLAKFQKIDFDDIQDLQKKVGALHLSFDSSQSGSRVSRSEPKYAFVPGEVLDLTDKIFEDVVKDEAVTVFVKFFAPWCGHCKSMAPAYKDLAKNFKNDKSVIIAEYDATKNKAYANVYGIQGYPTLKLFVAGKKKLKPEDYNGGRNKKDMLAFLASHRDTWRTSDGGVSAEAGLHEDYDKYLQAFLKADKEKRAAYLKETFLKETEKSEALDRAREFYIKVMEYIIKYGELKVKDEVDRLERILENPGSLSAENLLSTHARKNIFKKVQSYTSEKKKGEL